MAIRTRGARARASRMGLLCVTGIAAACSSPRPRAPETQVPEVFRTTRDQAGHELAKTEQFVVPVGTSIAVPGLEIPSPRCQLTEQQQVIMRQVFNSLEEITENTVNDTDSARVAVSRAMTFDVRASASSASYAAMAELCAHRAMLELTEAGTPPWRLRATTVIGPRRGPLAALPDSVVVVDFVRTK